MRAFEQDILSQIAMMDEKMQKIKLHLFQNTAINCWQDMSDTLEDD